MGKQRSWRKQAPRTNPERMMLHQRCGNKCFLEPKRLAFPICPKTSCQPSCQGLRAAYARARQGHRPKVARGALIRACHMGCEWTERHARCSR